MTAGYRLRGTATAFAAFIVLARRVAERLGRWGDELAEPDDRRRLGSWEMYASLRAQQLASAQRAASKYFGEQGERAGQPGDDV